MMKKFTKKIIRSILGFFGWKLIKITKHTSPRTHKVDMKMLNCLNNASGIMHLGAHRGTEAETYHWFGKKVIWFEAIPDIFQDLKERLHLYPTQKAFCTMLGDADNVKKNFYVSNCDGGLSSIFDFSKETLNKIYWPGNKYKVTKKLNLKMSKLDTILKENNVSAADYDHWIVDLQGGELVALKGAEESLKSCKSIYTEISKLKFYEGGVLWNELSAWLKERNFYPTEEPTNDHANVLFIKR